MKPRIKRYYARYSDGWSFVVRDPGEWVWAYFSRGETYRPGIIAMSFADLLAWADGWRTR